MSAATASQTVFDKDLAKLCSAIDAALAVRTESDGFRWIDESSVPAHILSAYRGLIEYGYATGLL